MPMESINRRIGGDHGLIFVVVIYMKIPAKGGPMHGPMQTAGKRNRILANKLPKTGVGKSRQV